MTLNITTPYIEFHAPEIGEGGLYRILFTSDDAIFVDDSQNAWVVVSRDENIPYQHSDVDILPRWFIYLKDYKFTNANGESYMPVYMDVFFSDIDPLGTIIYFAWRCDPKSDQLVDFLEIETLVVAFIGKIIKRWREYTIVNLIKEVGITTVLSSNEKPRLSSLSHLRKNDPAVLECIKNENKMKEYFSRYNADTAKNIYEAIFDAYKISKDSNKKMTQTLIAKQIPLSREIVNLYLNAFFKAGISSVFIEGKEIPIPKSRKKKHVKMNHKESHRITFLNHTFQ